MNFSLFSHVPQTRDDFLSEDKSGEILHFNDLNVPFIARGNKKQLLRAFFQFDNENSSRVGSSQMVRDHLMKKISEAVFIISFEFFSLVVQLNF